MILELLQLMDHYGSAFVRYRKKRKCIKNKKRLVRGHIIKQIPEEENMCPIMYDAIPIKGSYYICSQCHKNFDKNSLQRWLTSHITCPHCQGESTFSQLYRNG